MNAQLMGTPCLWEEPEARFAFPLALNAPFRHCRFSVFVVNHLPRAVWPINDQRKIYNSGLFGHLTRNARDVGFLDVSLFKLKPKVPLRVRRQRKDHYTRRVSIKTVHQKSVWKSGLNACQQTIR